MSYLQRLITLAVEGQKENNKVGKYSISPQHGTNVFKYQINKNNEYFVTITMYGLQIDIDVANQFKGTDLVEVVSVLQDLYPQHLVKTFQHATLV